MTLDRLKSATLTRQCLSTSRLALLRSLRSSPGLLQPRYEPSHTIARGDAAHLSDHAASLRGLPCSTIVSTSAPDAYWCIGDARSSSG